ncbi:phage portal protein [Streptomyces sp. SID4919]|uniref:phage portal protein n=1 Tax=unclassified Streptomyces TaxID=2593676 RepID=UPI000823E7DA|nr:MULTISPECIES: phage portal protein [unclassified Streptomyces]MYY08819.1 phage portal protein [Streptomyces sp. SID4919]SCK25529.1 phage portal protein, putative, A118 family [Streptomyces sp. AmelKG-E11A]
MALPDPGSAWPPPAWAPHYAQMRVDDAWYSGDRRRLDDVHGEQQRTPRRRLWGRKRPEAGRRDHRLHVPLPGDIASTSADLLFADMPRITVPDTATQSRLETLLDEGRVQQTLLSGAEQAAALSGTFLRVTWDRDLAPRPLLTVMQPDHAIPEWRFGMLRAVTFWRELTNSTPSQVWRHFERHEPGRIVHALYQGTPTNTGRRVPLTEHPDTADIAPTLDTDGDSIATGIRDLTAAYVPNMLPNRLHRTSPLGRSDYAAPLYDQFDALDEVWTSWMRDIRLARARLIVPDGYLRDGGPGNGAAFDEDREVFQSLKISPTDGTTGITLSQFKIRVEEHARTAEAIVRQSAQSAGYSPQSFGLDSEGQPVTATEVDSRDARSMVTRRKKAGYWKHPTADMTHVMLQLDAVLFASRITPERPRVEFGDGVAESEQQTATTLDLLARAGAVSTATKVKILNPEWDDKAVAAEAALILAETGAAAPDPVGNFPL